MAVREHSKRNPHFRLPPSPPLCQDFIEPVFSGQEGAVSAPDLRAAFANLDKDSTGFLDRPRFALALRGLRPSLELSPQLLRAAMDSFDINTSGNGNGSGVEPAGGSTIDYRQAKWTAKGRSVGTQEGSGARGERRSVRVLTSDTLNFRFAEVFDFINSVFFGCRALTYVHPRAFVIFCEEPKHPEVSPAVAVLRRQPLRPGGLDVFTQRDPQGAGFVCRVDLFDGLRELGVSGMLPKQART